MKSKNRSLVGVFAAVLLALVGGLLLWQNSDTEQSEAQEVQVEETQVLVAARDIKAGEKASAMDADAYAFVKIESFPVDQVQRGALTSVEDLANLATGGNITSREIRQGVQITLADFLIPGRQDVSAITPDSDLFELTVVLEPQRAFGGNLKAGMMVAVIGSFDASDGAPAQTVVLLESALITNVQTESLFSQEQLTSDPLAPSLAPTSRLFVTFGIPVEDVERLTFGSEFGHLWLARQGEDATIDNSEVRDRESVVVSLVDDGEDDEDDVVEPPVDEDSEAAEGDEAEGDEAG